MQLPPSPLDLDSNVVNNRLGNILRNHFMRRTTVAGRRAGGAATVIVHVKFFLRKARPLVTVPGTDE